MDQDRFDELSRALASRLPRRGLAGLAAGLLAALGGEAGAKRRGRGKDARDRAGTGGTDQAQDRTGGVGTGKDGAGGPEASGKKKPAACAAVGASCRKPKAGKAPKCCAGAYCDGATERCACGPGMAGCGRGCAPEGAPCCPAGEKACGGACIPDEACCEADFAACFAPHDDAWNAAFAPCAEPCEGGGSGACDACLEGALAGLVGPFVACFEAACLPPGGGTARAAAAAGGGRPAGPKRCNPVALSKCQTANLLGQQGVKAALMAGTGAGFVAATVVVNGGGLVLNPCRGLRCPWGTWCSQPAGQQEGICCPDCSRYDATRGRCEALCKADEECRLGVCRCKEARCHEHLVDGRQMPCGTVTNRCGKSVRCNGCPDGKVCADRRCVPDPCAAGTRRVATAAGEECCTPATCEGLGVACGPADDGCGETLDCGGCPDGQSCNAANACQPDEDACFPSGHGCLGPNECCSGVCVGVPETCCGTCG